MEIKPAIYNKESFTQWDLFVKSSKNATFLMHRDFIEYHKDRITDFSLIFTIKGKIIGLLPANSINHDSIYSHQGLTYGGIITNESMSASLMLDLFGTLKAFLSQQGFKEFIYKPIPHIYHRIPSEEDLYALYRNQAELISRNISSCIYYDTSISYAQLRKRGIKKAQNKGLSISESDNFAMFWQILETNLMQRHNAEPVHSLAEIKYLKSKFPAQIRLFEVKNGDQTVGGCVAFETDRVVHIQYISASQEGRQQGALDYLFDHLIQKAQSACKHFDFGTSTEHGGTILNEGLISQKEGFGARGIVYDTYRIKL